MHICATLLGRHRCKDLANVLSLDAVKANRENRLFDGFYWQAEHLLRCLGKGEQPATGLGGGVILGPQAQDAGNEDVKGAVTGLCHECDDGCFPFGHLSSKISNRLVNFSYFHCGGFFNLNWIDSIEHHFLA